jgi:HTH-type transcriptional regulator, sugar sensing transcriptional regulator
MKEMYHDGCISTLLKLGLSKSQAKIYLVLVKLGTVTAETVSTIAGVARPDTYRVLAELEKAGLVVKIISRPEMFNAIAIDDCVSMLLQQRTDETNEILHGAQSLSKLYRDNNIDKNLEKFQFILFPPKKPVFVKTEKMLKETQESVYIYGLSRRLTVWISNYLPLVEETLDRNVEFKIILPHFVNDLNLKKAFKSLRKYPNFHVRLFSQKPQSAFSIWDKKEILITTNALDSSDPASTLWSNNKSLVGLAQDYFYCLWAKSKVLKQKDSVEV